MVRVPNVLSRIVIAIFHGQDRAARQGNGLSKPIISLPVEIPVPDPEQRFLRAVGQKSGRSHFLAEVMRMRQQSENIQVDWQGIGIFGPVVRLSSRNIDLIRSQADFKWNLRGRLFGKEEGYGR